MLSNSRYLGHQMAEAIQALERALAEENIPTPDKLEVRFTAWFGDRRFGIFTTCPKEMLEMSNDE